MLKLDGLISSTNPSYPTEHGQRARRGGANEIDKILEDPHRARFRLQWQTVDGAILSGLSATTSYQQRARHRRRDRPYPLVPPVHAQ